ncbi:hypothetical protein BJV82DRAFT_581685 [Fennellomyces sp. T-0311]|nr:hypothetical protein BJV82DRAFT_581685 [Fennellomyces sp. T-0311]
MTTIPKSISVSTTGSDNVTELNVILGMYKPSDIPKFLNANPRLSSKLSALLEYTDNDDVRTSLTQGEKWRTCPLFQHPMVTSRTGHTFWVGDFVAWGARCGQLYRLSSFFLYRGVIKAKAHRAYYFVDSSLTQTIDGKGITLSYLGASNPGEWIDVDELFASEENLPCLRLRKRYQEQINNNMAVTVVPLNLFTHDTSGNSTKKWNKVESWSMVPAALPLSERNKRENTFPICLHNRLTAVEMLPDIVNDLKALEKGVIMHDSEANMSVLVVAPLNMIIGDNPLHAELASNKGTNATFPCRKCYFKKSGPQESTSTKQHHGAPHRDPVHVAFFLANIRLPTGCGVELFDGTTEHDLSKLGYKEQGSGSLLELEAFDITRDLPVEALHCLMLGVTKYLVNDLCDFLSASEKRTLEARLRHYNSKGYARAMTSNLQLQGLFVGRDYKTFAQQLPLILDDLVDGAWPTMPNQRKSIMTALCSCFHSQGELLSLLYMAEIPSDFDKYKRLIRTTVDKLCDDVNAVDAALLGRHKNRKGGRLGNRPKLHLLHHVCEDINQFASIIHFEAEKGEQFNKFIHERIFHTNRHSISVDVLRLFGHHTIFRHIVENGSWLTATEERTTGGPGIIEHLNENPVFKAAFMGGSQEFTENNQSSQKLKVGLCGFFTETMENGTRSSFLVRVVGITKENVRFNVYQFVDLSSCANANNPQSIINRYGTDFGQSIFYHAYKSSRGYAVVKKKPQTPRPIPIESISLEEVIDLQVARICNNQDEFIVNPSKFAVVVGQLMTKMVQLQPPDK